MRFPILHIRRSLLTERSKHIRLVFSQTEPSGQDADHSVRLAVKNKRHADRCRAGGEAALPQTVADDDHWRRAWPVFVGQEGAPPKRGDAQNGKHAGGNLSAVHVVGFAGLAHRTSCVAPRGHVERLARALAIEIIRVCERPETPQLRAPIGLLLQADQPIGLRVRQRPEQHAVDDGKHDGGGSAAEG